MEKFDHLIDRLQNEENIEIRRYIPDKLAKLGSWESTSYLSQVLINKNEPNILRIECAESLGKQGDPRALTALAKVVKDQDPELRRTVIWSLGQIGTERSLPIIKKAMSDSDSMCRKWVAKSLGRIQNPNSLSMLQDYWEKNATDFSMETQLLLADIIRSVTKHVESNVSIDINSWFDTINLIISEKSTSFVLLQASLQFIKEIAKSGLIGDFLYPEHVMTTENIIILNEILEIAFILGQDDVLNRFIQHSDSRIRTRLQRYLPNSIDNLQTSNSSILIEQLIGIDNSITSGEILIPKNKINEIYSQYSSNRSVLILLFKINVKQALDFDLLQNRLSDKLYYSTAIKLLVLFPNKEEIVDIIKNAIMNKEKRYRETALELIKNLIGTTPFVKILKVLLENVAVNDRVWHIRRDARILLHII